MITILHGDHIDASRKVLQKYKEPEKGVELRVISGRQLDDNTLVQTLESSSLFSDSTRVIIEQLFSSLSKQQKRIEKVCSVLKNNAKQNIVIWEDKKISPSRSEEHTSELQSP
jgi:DNA polymerase III delta subunit